MADERLSPYIRRREDGMLCVGDTKVFLDGVADAFDHGETPESIRENYPSISLEQVQGAIAYYLGHREAVREYMRRNHEEFERLRAENHKIPNPTVDRLRAILRERRQAEQSK